MLRLGPAEAPDVHPMTVTPTSALRPMLKTGNLPATISFYTETLGFIVVSQMNDEGGNPYWARLEWGPVGLMFYSSHLLDSPPGPTAMTGVLYCNPVDVRALWFHLKERTEVEWELQEMPYGSSSSPSATPTVTSCPLARTSPPLSRSRLGLLTGPAPR